MEDNKFPQTAKLQEAHQGEKTMAREEFDANVETAKDRLKDLETQIKEVAQSEKISEQDILTSWKALLDIRDTNFKNLNDLQKRYGLKEIQDIQTSTGSAKQDVIIQAMDKLRNSMVKVQQNIVKLKEKMESNG